MAGFRRDRRISDTVKNSHNDGGHARSSLRHCNQMTGVDDLEHLGAGGHLALERARIAIAQQLLRLVIDIQLGQIRQSIAQPDETGDDGPNRRSATPRPGFDRIGDREIYPISATCGAGLSDARRFRGPPRYRAPTNAHKCRVSRQRRKRISSRCSRAPSDEILDLNRAHRRRLQLFRIAFAREFVHPNAVALDGGKNPGGT